jgi:RimJ/RimL family protein N-acetyltransferase
MRVLEKVGMRLDGALDRRRQRAEKRGESLVYSVHMHGWDEPT